eukprot:symbB.v1.2.035695.t1/scaffold4868.1/size33687/1
MLEPPPQDMQEYMDSTESTGPDGITAVLVREIKRERVLLLRCVQAFQQRQQEADLRPVPTTLAEPLARLRSGQASGSDMMQARFREMVKFCKFGPDRVLQNSAMIRSFFGRATRSSQEPHAETTEVTTDHGLSTVQEDESEDGLAKAKAQGSPAYVTNTVLVDEPPKEGRRFFQHEIVGEEDWRNISTPSNSFGRCSQ